MVLTTNKGVALEVMVKDMYIEKCLALLSDQEVYQEYKDQTKSTHAKVLKQSLDLKHSIGTNLRIKMSNSALLVTTALLSESMVLPKIHKANIPHRPMVSSCGTSTYKLAKFLTIIIQ